LPDSICLGEPPADMMRYPPHRRKNVATATPSPVPAATRLLNSAAILLVSITRLLLGTPCIDPTIAPVALPPRPGIVRGMRRSNVHARCAATAAARRACRG